MTHRMIWSLMLALATPLTATAAPDDGRQDLYERLAEQVMRGNYYTPRLSPISDQPYLKGCVEALRRRNIHVEDVRFNQYPPRKNSINVYILRSPGEVGWQLTGNCAYVGFDNIIVCDYAYIVSMTDEYYKKHRDLFPGSYWLPDGRLVGEEEARAKLGDAFEIMKVLGQVVSHHSWLWMIGHEIGHIASPHAGLHFTFEGTGSESRIQYSGEKYKRLEEEADAFAVEAIPDESVGQFLFLSLGQYINGIGLTLLKEQHGVRPEETANLPGNKKNLVHGNLRLKVTAESTTHPPLFVRAIDIRIGINKRFKFEPEQYHGNLRKRIDIVGPRTDDDERPNR